MRRKGNFIYTLTLFVGVTCVLSVSCNKNSLDGMIVAVELQSSNDLSSDGASLIAMDPEHPNKPAKVISNGFHSACSPVLSNTGRYLIFSAKDQQGATWQIWQRDLKKRSNSRVTDLPENCTDPAFLPDGKVVFSRSGTIKDKKVSNLFKCNRDGSELQQLTFHPHLDYASSVLNDGRILYTSSQQYPVVKNPAFFVMLPDGSKSDLFYGGNEDAFPISSGIEYSDGYIYFIERNPHNREGGRLVVINHNRPLHSHHVLSEGLEGEFRSIISYGQSMSLVSYRPVSDVPYALYEFDNEEYKVLGKVYSSGKDVVDPILVRPRKRPRILPSAVNPENPTGQLMTQDINHSMIQTKASISNDTLADRIQVLGLEAMLGEVKVEEDGSFYLKIDADKPFRIVSMNQKGETIRGPSGWIWLRPGERRGCVGCHADPELAPENRVPMAVKHPPVFVSSKEKEISKLEESVK